VSERQESDIEFLEIRGQLHVVLTR
jgi:hypothetical protein